MKVWNPVTKKYIRRSTKETNRLDAIAVTEEWLKSKSAILAAPPENKTFRWFTRQLTQHNKLNASEFTMLDHEKTLETDLRIF